MSLLFMDRPSHLNTATLAMKWGVVGSGITVASEKIRSTSSTLGAAILETPNLGPIFDRTAVTQMDEGYLGFLAKADVGALPLSGYTTWVVLSILDSNRSPLITLTHNANGYCRFMRGDWNGTPITDIGTESIWENNADRVIRVGWKISSTTGYVEVRSYDVTETTDHSLLIANNINTVPGSKTTWRYVRFYCGTFVDFSHFYILGGGGIAPNYFLSPKARVYECPINGAGNSTYWTPSAGSNYQNVDDATPDEESTYNRAQADVTDFYAISDTELPAMMTIYGIQLNAIARKESSLYANMLSPLWYSSTLNEQETQAPTLEYKDIRAIWDSAVLTIDRDDFSSMQIGVKHYPPV